MLVTKKWMVSDSAIFWLIFFLCFCFRFLYVATLDISIPIRGDAVAYVQYASNLIEHGVFSKEGNDQPLPDSYWSPGYPVFLALSATLAGFFKVGFYPLALFLQAIMGGLIAALVFSFGRFVLPQVGAIAAATLTSLSPHLTTHGGYILSETLFCFLLLSGLFCYVKAINQHYSVWFAAVGGAFLGLAYLTSPVMLFVPIILVLRLLFLGYISKTVQLPPRFPAVFLTCFFVFVVGWSIRDKVSVDEQQLSSSDRAFENLIIGSHSNFHDVWRANPRDPENPSDLDNKQYKNDHHAFYAELASRILAEPAHYLRWYFIQKPSELWGWDILVGYGDIYVYRVDASLYHKSKLALVSLVLMKQIHFWLFGAALLGLLFVLREKNKDQKETILSVYVCLFCVSAVYVILHTDARYSIPLRPEMYIAAVYGIWKIYNAVQQRIYASHQSK